MKTELIKITPEKAKQLLKKNKKNRPVSQKRVKYYATLMEEGKWHTTHQGIAVSKSGIIIDGQHRLIAVVESGVTVMMNVTTGVEEETFKYVDVGYTRTTSNIFAIEGIQRYTTHSSGISKYLTLSDLQTGGSDHINKISKGRTHQDALDVYYQYEDLLLEIMPFIDSYYSKFRILTTSELYAYFCLLIIDKGYEIDRVKAFFDNVYMERHDSKSNLPVLLFNRLIADLTGATELKKSHRNAFVIKAWNCFVKGKSLKILKFAEDEKYPKFI